MIIKTFHQFIIEMSYRYLKSQYTVLAGTSDLIKVKMDTVYQLFDVKRDVPEQWELVISQASSIDSIPLNVMREQAGSVDIAVMVTKKSGKFTTFIWDRDNGPLHEQALNLIKMAVDSQTKRKTLFGASTLSKDSDLGKKILHESYPSTEKSEKILQIIHKFFSN